jgi:serine/threonine protein kinase
MMVLDYYKNGNLRNYYLNNQHEDYSKNLSTLLCIAIGLLSFHDAGFVHKDFHPGNILLNNNGPIIGDLGLCQPEHKEKKGVYGVLPYVAPEVLCGHQYTKAADIYSFGIVMNELLSEEIPYNDIPHDQNLTANICQGLRPKISEDTPKLLADLIMKCWDAKAKNRPTAKELYQIICKLAEEYRKRGEFYSQVKICEGIRKEKLENRPDRLKNIQTHPQAIYTSRLLNFSNLPEPVNSSDLSSFQYNPGNIWYNVILLQILLFIN